MLRQNLVILYGHLLLVSANLYQLNRILCPFDEVVYVCSNELSPSLNWRLELLDGSTTDINLNANFESPGYVYYEQVASSPIIVEVITGNNSSITSSLTLRATQIFNSSKIFCNSRQTTTLILPELKEYLPSILILTPTGQEQNGGITFIATWNSSSMLESTELTLSISPAPLHGESVRTISNASFLLSLNSNTLYALNISMCNLTYSVQFMLGRCPFVKAPFNQHVIRYKISHTGSTTVLVRCTACDIIYQIECGMNGLWDIQASGMSTTISSLFSEETTIFTENYTVEEISVKTLHVPTLMMPGSIHISVMVLSISLIAALIIGLIIGSLLALLCSKIKKMNKRCSKSAFIVATPSQTSNIPIYEDIKLNYTDNIDISRNIAYEEVKNTAT